MMTQPVCGAASKTNGSQGGICTINAARRPKSSTTLLGTLYRAIFCTTLQPT
jgi:hypothetical protein